MESVSLFPGITEAETWTQDGNGWTTCYFNRTPDLAAASKAHGGLEDPDKVGQFVFDSAGEALKAAEALGQKVVLPEDLTAREARLKSSKDGRLAIEIDREKDDRARDMPGWIDKKGKWVRLFDVQVGGDKADELGSSQFDDLFRELESASREGIGWVILKNGEWVHKSTKT